MANMIWSFGKEPPHNHTHGNGPQSGNLALQQDLANDQIPAQPLDVVGAMTQGQIGYILQNTLQNLLEERKTRVPVINS